jgi:hypothetical protein
VFTKNRERLQEGDVFQKFMTKLLNHEKVKPLLSDEHFSVDGTLIEAWASHKSFKPKQAKKDDDGRTFTARSARTIRIKARPTPKPSSTARLTAQVFQQTIRPLPALCGIFRDIIVWRN